MKTELLEKKIIPNHFSNYEVSKLMESAENCVDMLLKAAAGKFQFQTTNFDPACFADIMIPLNQELKNRKLETIRMPCKIYYNIVELKKKDYTYKYSLEDFYKWIKPTNHIITPTWYKPIQDKDSIPLNTTADKILGGLQESE